MCGRWCRSKQQPGLSRVPAAVVATECADRDYRRLHRWFTVGPVGLMHAASRDIEWRGWKIPEGTGLIYNSMAIHHDPAVYPEPYQFIPERWEGRLEMATEDSLGASTELFTFGAGRRICPGQHLAERSLFLGISHWLWAFDIRKARDQAGNEIDVDTSAIKPGLTRMLMPYQVEIRPRTEAKAELIGSTWKAMKADLLTSDEQWKSAPEEVKVVFERVKAQKARSL